MATKHRSIFAVSGRVAVRGILLSLLFVQAACVQGLIYEDVTVPLDTDMDRSRLASEAGEASATRIREPFSVVKTSVEWSSFGIGDAAESQSVQLCAADLRVQSAVLGIWRRDTVKVYRCAGEGSPAAESAPSAETRPSDTPAASARK